MDLIDSYVVRTAALAALALLVTQGIPRAVRTIYNWTSAALFGALTGRLHRAAMVLAAASVFWLFIVVSVVYTPAALLVPQVLPLPGGLIRLLILIELWLLVLLPVIVGAIEAYVSKGSLPYRLTMFPRAFVHVAAIGAAMVLLAPWTITRFARVTIRRLQAEQVRIDIDPNMYDSVVEALVGALRGAGLAAVPKPLPVPVRAARFVLFRFGPPFVRQATEYDARRIEGNGYWLLVFDGLIDVVARKNVLSRVRAGLVGKMPPPGLWLTQSGEARELERYIRTEGTNLSDVPRRIATVDASLEEWRTLSWEYTQVLAREIAEENAELIEAEREPEQGPPSARNV